MQYSTGYIHIHDAIYTIQYSTGYIHIHDAIHTIQNSTGYIHIHDAIYTIQYSSFKIFIIQNIQYTELILIHMNIHYSIHPTVFTIHPLTIHPNM